LIASIPSATQSIDRWLVTTRLPSQYPWVRTNGHILNVVRFSERYVQGRQLLLNRPQIQGLGVNQDAIVIEKQMGVAHDLGCSQATL
jgi:hypothetical protein